MHARRQWDGIFEALKENRQPGILYLVKISFKNNCGIKTFPHKAIYKKLILKTYGLKLRDEKMYKANTD